MCYSAKIWSDYRQYVREFGAELSVGDFYDLLWSRTQGAKVSVPPELEAAVAADQSPDGRKLWALVEQYHAQLQVALKEDLAKQQARLATAEHSLAKRVTKSATESQRIARSKISAITARLDRLANPSFQVVDARIYPGSYAPVMVSIDGRRKVLPMRYQCRPAGKPASYDTQFPGTYNARLDNLQGFWRGQFGHTHGVVVTSAFYENVPLHLAEGRVLQPGEPPRTTVVEFQSDPPQELLLACLWSRWSSDGEDDLLSFALITDEPPPEVAAAGHDRCVVPIRPEYLDAWLNPDPKDTQGLYALLRDRQPVTFRHQLAK